jgi:hypothetical protein
MNTKHQWSQFMNYGGSVMMFAAAFLCQTLLSQEIDSIITRYTSATVNRSSEMIYLQTSKGIYETGEDLWFKAYLLDAQTLYLSGRSQTLYLQMLNEVDGKVVWQEKYPVENGIVAGHVYVHEYLSEGDYFLEAYTRCSFLADSTEMTSIRKVRIVENINHKEASAVSPAEMVADKGLRFETFPEGGNLLAGIPSKLAFKATDGQGYPVEVSGVLHQDDVPLLEFESAHAGMGLICFTPHADKTYHIRLSDGGIFPLPEIYPQGMSLHLEDRDSAYLVFTILQSEGLSKQTFYITGQMRGIVYCVAQATVKRSMQVKMPLHEFPGQGIAEFTLYDENLLPVAERLVYVYPEKKLYITAEPDKRAYHTREKASLKLKVTDEKGRPVVAHLGVSVFDSYYKNPDDPVHILTHVHLSSQIRGRIYDPAYYFDEKSVDRKEAMDLLMLTQGWRRYVWGEDNLKPAGQIFLSDDITGIQTIKQKKGKTTTPLIQVLDSGGNGEYIEADEAGRFTVESELLKSFENGYLYLKPLLSKDEYKPKVSFDDMFPVIQQTRLMKKTYYPLANPNEIIKEDTHPYVTNGDVIAMKGITVTAKARKPFRNKLMGRLDSLAKLDVDAPWVCVHGYLENYKEGYSHVPCHPMIPETTAIDDTRITPVEGQSYHLIKYELQEEGWLLVTDVQYYVVYRGPIYSEEELLERNNLWKVKGYYGIREFYQPDEYDVLDPVPDARNTLFWSPSIVTDAQGEASVEFYCSDTNATFTGQIEGSGNLGLMGETTFEFRVINTNILKLED